MPTIATQLETKFKEAIQRAFGLQADPLIGVAQNESFGDYQSNVAMGLAKRVSEQTGQKTNPRAVAEAIVGRLELGELADAPPTIAGPGFINIRLSNAFLARQLQSPPDQLPADHPQTIVVDYSGPNIAKQMHVGHLRSTIIGDAISRVMEHLGHAVIRQNHIGDWGTQFGMLIAHFPEGSVEAINIIDLEKFYREAKTRFDADPVFQESARKQVVALQSGDPRTLKVWARIVDLTRAEYQPLYERLGVRLRKEHERGESFYNPFLADVVKELKEKGLAQESDGAVVVFVDGPDKSPLIIEKTGGGFLYGTTDLAAIRYRVKELHADRIIYTHDSRQAQHFRQVFDTARRASWTRGDAVQLDYAPFGTMLGEDGKPFKTRSGDTVKLKDLLDEAEERAFTLVTGKNPDLPETQRRDIARAIGIGAIKYADLSKDRISDYVFNWNTMLAMDGNTAPYLQYAYARIRSIFRKQEAAQPDADTPISLDTPHERALAKHLVRFIEIVQSVAVELKPHHLCAYLYELATRFSGFYENCPVLSAPHPVRASRLRLCQITADTLSKGLDLLGIEHPEQM